MKLKKIKAEIVVLAKKRDRTLKKYEAAQSDYESLLMKFYSQQSRKTTL
jgi:hypothetical protein